MLRKFALRNLSKKRLTPWYHFTSTKKEFKSGGVSGIKVLGRYKVQIDLVEAFAGFDKLLTYSGFGVFPKEAYEFYKADVKKHPVGTGPFMMEEFSPKGIKLKRNPNYWAKDQFGNQLPFLAGIELCLIPSRRRLNFPLSSAAFVIFFVFTISQ